VQNVGENARRHRRLLQLDPPNMTIAGLSAALGKTTRTIERTLAAMQAQGKIQRIGGDKGALGKY
jgi:DeoR/GlpR family transcriptional regulator of sugar metabolism